jgi:alcohol dehydrogenase
VSNDQFFFQLHTKLFYGIGSSKEVAQLVETEKYENVAIIVDQGVSTTSYYHQFKDMLSKKTTIIKEVVARGTEEPDYDYLDEVVGEMRQYSIDLLIGIGGGSCLDLTKAVAVLMTNSGKGIDYRGFDKVNYPGVPTVAIPTTAGTGSEVTINAVFTDKKEMRKLGINGRYMHATYAVLDAEWTMSCPTHVAVSSGMDAIVHSLESFMCNQHNVLTRIYSKEAFKLLYTTLPSLIDDPTNKQQRQKLLLGSYLAGIALFNSGSGIAGALSYPIGVHYKVPHGIGGGIFIASVVDFNVQHGYYDYSELLDLIEYTDSLSPQQKAERFVQKMYELADKLNVPKYLDKWGITKEKVDEVVELMLPLQAAFNQNPVEFVAERDVKPLLLKHVKE